MQVLTASNNLPACKRWLSFPAAWSPTAKPVETGHAGRNTGRPVVFDGGTIEAEHLKL
jgi:hypothetical protein